MIRQILEKRAGEADRWCPEIICDGCGERIAEDGNVRWEPKEGGTGGPQGWELKFYHKRCDRRVLSHSEELDVWLYQLVWNAKVDWKKAKARADLSERF